MSHVFKIAVLLPTTGGGDLLVWRQWCDRQRDIERISEPERRVTGLLYDPVQATRGEAWEAFGITRPEQLQGREFDEVVISHPKVDHELIQLARTVLR